jgi:ATP-dependent exoDNAse (exonuclease V) alpha subunit
VPIMRAAAGRSQASSWIRCAALREHRQALDPLRTGAGRGRGDAVVDYRYDRFARSLDSGEHVWFNLCKHRSLDYGYAVTSHSSQGTTARRALILADTAESKTLVNERMAYVSISRGADDVRIYTDSAEVLGEKLSRNKSKTQALEFGLSEEKSVARQNEQAMGG